MSMKLTSNASILTNELKEWIQQILQRVKVIEEIWLIGSRANGMSKPDSDWDFFVFGKPGALELLSVESDLWRSDVDLLVIEDGDNFKSAWTENKTGSLSDWQWVITDPGIAEYMGTKWIPSEVDPDEVSPHDISTLGKTAITRNKGLKLYPAET